MCGDGVVHVWCFFHLYMYIHVYLHLSVAFQNNHCSVHGADGWKVHSSLL